MAVIRPDENGNAPSTAKIGDIVVTSGGNYEVVAPNTPGANYNESNGLWSTLYTGQLPAETQNTGNVVASGANGNAPSGTKVGDTVLTQGGTYKVVEPNTPGASYNPSSGLWSIKVNDDKYMGGSNAPYVPLGDYNDAGLSPADKARVEALSKAWFDAQARGDVDAMNRAHAEAQAIRAQYNYSGGLDGSQYLAGEQWAGVKPSTPTDGMVDLGTLPEYETIKPPTLPTYQPQSDRVNDVYDSALKSALAQLESSYNLSRLRQEAELEKIPGIYQKQANQTAAQAERTRQAYNEYAAYNGLNAGNGSQAQLAMNNQLQGDLTNIGINEANAVSAARQKLAELYTAYQGSISEAVANNEYEKAAALLAEYQKQAQSVVDVAQSQAQLDMSAAQINQNNKAKQFQDMITAMGFNRDTNQQNTDNAMNAAQWKFQQEQWKKEQDEASYQKLVNDAETLAAFGIFTGYKALGYSDADIARMEKTWKAMNPKTMAWMGVY